MWTILVAEENFYLRHALLEILELEGYRVFPTRDGFQALQHIRQIKPHLILSAVRLPSLNGINLLGAIKSDERLQHIPFIFVTGSAEVKQRLANAHLEASYLVEKPFYVDSLLSIIEQFLPLPAHLPCS